VHALAAVDAALSPGDATWDRQPALRNGI